MTQRETTPLRHFLNRLGDSYKIIFYMVIFLADCEKVFNFAAATPW